MLVFQNFALYRDASNFPTASSATETFAPALPTVAGSPCLQSCAGFFQVWDAWAWGCLTLPGSRKPFLPPAPQKLGSFTWPLGNAVSAHEPGFRSCLVQEKGSERAISSLQPTQTSHDCPWKRACNSLRTHCVSGALRCQGNPRMTHNDSLECERSLTDSCCVHQYFLCSAKAETFLAFPREGSSIL